MDVSCDSFPIISLQVDIIYGSDIEIVERNLSSLAEKTYDLVIIGGGIFGICAAWDAVLRGFSVALIERKDFVSGASANCYKIVHGGIRYLQHGDIARIRSSCRERSAFLRVAPHLVQPLPILVPTYGYGKKGKALLATGMFAYDLMTCDRNTQIPDPDRHIPNCWSMTRQEVLAHYPALEPRGLTGAMVFYDGQMYNPPRLGLSFLKSAVQAGVEAANYLEATDFLWSGHQITGVQVRDTLTGQRFQIYSKTVLNAAGPWAERLLAKQATSQADSHHSLSLMPAGTYSRDTCFVIPQRLKTPYAAAVTGKTKDPDAVFSRDARHLFLVPWRDYTLVGVWHVVYDQNPDDLTVTDQELQSFVDEINWAYPGLALTLKDICFWNAGLVPFGDNSPGAQDLSYGKRSQLIDHQLSHQIDNLVTLIGIRYTMARGDAAKAIDLISAKLNRQTSPPKTDYIPVYGGDIQQFEALIHQIRKAVPATVTDATVSALAHNYGSAYLEVLTYLGENPEWASTLGTSTVLQAEVIHAIRQEMAQKLSDIVFRRTDLATGAHPGDEALTTCAKVMASELGWTPEKMVTELNEVKQALPFPVPEPTIQGRPTALSSNSINSIQGEHV